MKYGLIGKSLTHSYSKIIHQLLGCEEYELQAIDEKSVDDLLTKKDFLGINVTIPYKEYVLKKIDYLSLESKNIGAVNTIVNRNNKLYGYNTDYFGFKYLIEHYKVNVSHYPCYVLGTGGTSKTIKYVLEEKKAIDVYTVSRTKRNNTITYDEFYNIINKKPGIIINATPLGMYPNFEKSIALEKINSLNVKGIIDVIYNPIQTKLIQFGIKNNILSINGLDMLIMQAISANQLFFSKEILDINEKLQFIKKEIEKKFFNIVLIGMPGVGKSYVASKVSKNYNFKLYDIDQEIEKDENMIISQIFKTNGEKYFRAKESLKIKEISTLYNVVIATGGGVILNENNMINLKANGIIVFLDLPLSKIWENIQNNNNRPLVKSYSDLEKLYQSRISLYQQYADITINPEEIDKLDIF